MCACARMCLNAYMHVYECVCLRAYCARQEFARSNTDVRIGLQDKLRHKGSTIHSSDCDILSNDHSMRNVLRKKRGDTALMHNIPTRRPYRTLSEERLGDEVNSIMAYNCLNTYSNSGKAACLPSHLCARAQV